MRKILNKFGRLNWSKRLRLFLTAGTTFLLLLPTPAAALFGIGDVVFDPTSYATLAKIWSSDATTLTKVIEEVTQLGKIYGNAVQTYNQAMAMAQRAQPRQPDDLADDRGHCRPRRYRQPIR